MSSAALSLSAESPQEQAAFTTRRVSAQGEPEAVSKFRISGMFCAVRAGLIEDTWPMRRCADAPVDDGVDVAPDWDEAAQPAPEDEVDQRVSW